MNNRGPGEGPAIRIGARRVGAGAPVYVVAEMSANHGGDLRRAERLVRAAAAAGADAIKLQTYTPDGMTLDSARRPFRIRGTLWRGRTLHDLYREAQTPWEWHRRLQRVARKAGIDFFSTAFEPAAVDFLESLRVPVHKVASFEAVDLPLIRRIASTRKPLILSTGMCTLTEIREAVDAARGAGARGIVLLKCTSAYPTPPEEMNLLAIPRLSRELGLPVGLSDHTLGIEVPLAAVALGACLVEKHVTLSRRDRTPDAAFSLEPGEFRAMVDGIRKVERSLGRPRLGPGRAEAKSRVFRRSLFVVRDVRRGERFTPENLRSIRPGDGLAPKHLPRLLGRRASRDLRRGTALRWRDVLTRKRS